MGLSIKGLNSQKCLRIIVEEREKSNKMDTRQMKIGERDAGIKDQGLNMRTDEEIEDERSLGR